MHNIKLVIFDMDGLLVDSEGHYSDGWKYAINLAGYEIDQKTIDSWVGQGKQKTIDTLLSMTQDQAIVDAIVDSREQYIYDMLSTGKISEMPYATFVLKRLIKKGYVIGVASSTHRKRATDILKYLNLSDYISYASFGDDVDNVKPDPGVYLKVLADSGFSESEAIAVEDSFTGTLAASNAGLKTLVIPYVEFETNRIESIENVLGIEKNLKALVTLLNI